MSDQVDATLDAVERVNRPGAAVTPSRGSTPRLAKLRRYGLAAIGALALIAAALAAFAPQAAGLPGLIFLGGLAAAALIILVALASRGRRWRALRGAASEEGAERVAPAGAVFEALSEPALIVDRHGAPRKANPAYRAFAERAGLSSFSGRPAGLERVFGGHASAASAVFRIARAAQRGETLREITGRAPLAEGGAPRAFELETTPLQGGESMWRVREIRESGEVAPSEPAPKPAPSVDGYLNDAPVGFFSASTDGRIVYLNRTLSGWLGVADGAEGLKLKDFVSEPARVLGRGRRPGGAPVRADVKLKCRDGIVSSATILTTWPETGPEPKSRSIVFERGGLGAPVGVPQSLAPAGEGAAVAGGMMDAMFAHAPFGVARLDGVDPAVALIRDANPALLEMTGGAASPGARLSDLFVLEDPERRDAFEAAGTGPEEAVELELKQDPAPQKGEERYARVFFAPEPGGRLTAYLLDITAERTYLAQMLHSQKMDALGAVTAETAHNMNNILLAIELRSGMLLQRHPIGDPDYEDVAEISASAQNGAGLTGALLAFARKQQFQPQVIELSEAVSDFFVTVRTLVGRQVTAKLEHGSNLPYVKVDRGQLMQAIINLTNNARDAMLPKGGDLTVRTSVVDGERVREAGQFDAADGNYAVIEVSDTGRGMDPETCKRVFEPFYTTKPAGKGHGLGLSTVFGIITQSGGHVEVDSAIGKGTTFTMFIPAYEATAEERESARRQPRNESRKPRDLSGSGRILLVEDNDFARRASALALKQRGYEVIEAEDGYEALDILEEHASAIDLVLSDVSMPGMDGPTLLQEARHLLGDTPVVFMSGLTREDLADTLAAEPNVRFLAKPFRVEDLAAMMKSEMPA